MQRLLELNQHGPNRGEWCLRTGGKIGNQNGPDRLVGLSGATSPS
jgi:hypothetical protein